MLCGLEGSGLKLAGKELFVSEDVASKRKAGKKKNWTLRTEIFDRHSHLS